MLLLFFSILACNTSNTKWLIYSRSQHITRLANDFPVFLLNRSRIHWLIQSFSLLACNTSISQKKKYLCMYIDKQNQLKKKYYFFLFWPVTLQTLNGSSTVLVSTSQA